MTYKEKLLKYIETYEVNTPIFIEEIKEYFERLISDDTEYKREMNSIYTYLNRLVRKGELNSFSNGIYYKEQVIEKKYIRSDDKVFGYKISGLIVSNACKKKTCYYNKTLGVRVRKPRVKITNENYIFRTIR